MIRRLLHLGQDKKAWVVIYRNEWKFDGPIDIQIWMPQMAGTWRGRVLGAAIYWFAR